MRTLIKNVTAIPLDEKDRILEDVEIALVDQHITAVGKALADFDPDEVVDGREMVALPAFFNAHTHAPMTLERGWAEDLAFDRWLNEKIWVAESALEEENVYWGAALIGDQSWMIERNKVYAERRNIVVEGLRPSVPI